MIRLKDAVITSLALCKRAKNGLRTVYKSDNGQLELRAITKASKEEGELLAVVYAPERVDEDGEGMTANEIRKAAHRAMRDGGLALDIEHNGKKLAKSEAYVAESFIIAPGDSRFADWRDYDDQPVGDLTGAWASVIRLETEALRKAHRDGELDGVSMFGHAAVERASTSKAAERVVQRLEDAHQSEIEMTPEQLQAALKANNDALLATIDARLNAGVAKSSTAEGSQSPTQEPAVPAKPVFKGSATDVAALAAYQAELEAWELNEKVRKGEMSASDLAAVIKARSETEPSDAEAGIEKGDTEEVRGLKRKLFKARKTSNVRKSASETEQGGDEPAGDGKFDEKAAREFGLSIAGIANGSPRREGGNQRVLTGKAD